MNKEIALISILTLISGLLIGSFVLRVMDFSDSNNSLLLSDERNEVIKTFAGCNYDPSILNADDQFFTGEWNKQSMKYEFTIHDVDSTILTCNGDELIAEAEERISHPKRHLTSQEIEDQVKQSLETYRTYKVGDANPEGRKLTAAESIETEKEIRESLKGECWDIQENMKLMDFQCSESIETVRKQVSEMKNYQNKFLNREFSVLQNQ